MHVVLVKLIHFIVGRVNLGSFVLSLIYLKILWIGQCDIYTHIHIYSFDI